MKRPRRRLGEGIVASSLPGQTYVQIMDAGRYLWQCRNCNWSLEAETNEPVEHVCGRKEVVRLGDRIGAALGSVGVTPESWSAAKAKIGLPASCNCEARKEWLNKIDETLQLGERMAAFTKALGWSK